MKFRLMTTDKMGNKVGGHSQGKVKNGRFSEHYERGQILESDRPLDTLFRGKFERLDGPSPAPESEPKAKGRRK
jgi:hypothetical protein